MNYRLVKFRKVPIIFLSLPLIWISNNSELAAKYLINKEKNLFKNQDIDKFENNFSIELNLKKENASTIAKTHNQPNEENVLISEIIIEGWEDHPEGRK